MKKQQVIRALRDEEYFLNLTDADQSRLPAHPAGVVDIRNEDLTSASGGHGCGNPSGEISCYSAGGSCCL